ncbi:uncharacterized protein F4812DRAFT_469398 [Daldinia caldariorum]|uniref:uncharacterized protein n=1 Tax=Daldinia caldariorum TaxID=326644 RepID=UPI002007E1B0|nr:uncharacterized protein F4812DRAFT_469398 [Daldinia caldariorum]KAI1470936.1 hypothetical protein F4812DRAFT_469398 [Daldinia caldariorum]
MNTYTIGGFLLALIARAFGLDASQSPEPISTTVRTTTLTSTRTVTTHPILWINTSVEALRAAETAMASVFDTTEGAGGAVIATANTTTTKASKSPKSRTKGRCITITPNLSTLPHYIPSTGSMASNSNLSTLPPYIPSASSVATLETSASTAGNKSASPAITLWPKPGIANPPEAPSSSFIVPQITSSSVKASSAPNTPTSSTILSPSIPPKTSSSEPSSSTSQSSALPTPPSSSQTSITTSTSSQVTSTSSVGTGYGEATTMQTTTVPGHSSQSTPTSVATVSLSPTHTPTLVTTVPLSPIHTPTTTLKVSAIDKKFPASQRPYFM